MGMYDTLRSSYDLGEQFTDAVFQTKDIEDGIGGTMTDYWLDPAGVLWCPDYSGTNTFEVIPEDDPRYNEKLSFLNFEWVPTGQHGAYRPYLITKYIEIYHVDWEGSWEQRPRLRLHFKYGILQDYEDITGR
jgi:hypothetical protein